MENLALYLGKLEQSEYKRLPYKLCIFSETHYFAISVAKSGIRNQSWVDFQGLHVLHNLLIYWDMNNTFYYKYIFNLLKYLHSLYANITFS